MIEWQPIETAPKDGTDFIGLKDDGTCHVIYFDEENEAWVMMGFPGGTFLSWVPHPHPLNENMKA